MICTPLLLFGAGASISLRIGLHAQVSPSSGIIVGSELTTSGLKRALLRHSSVANATTFYAPVDYEDLPSRPPFDLFIIEGWFESIAVFIHEARRHSPRASVLFWALDPAFPSLDELSALKTGLRICASLLEPCTYLTSLLG